MALKLWVLGVTSLASLAVSQRPFFAGTRPIGYPELITTTAATDDLGNRFGEGNSTVSTTTQRLPLEALGDKNLVDRLSKLPIDKQPFWFINWKAYEAHRQKPQTYPLRPSPFAEPISPGIANSASFNNNPNTNIQGNISDRIGQSEINVSNASAVNRNASTAINNINAGTSSIPNLGNRNSETDSITTAKPSLIDQRPVESDVSHVSGSKNKDSNIGNQNGNIATNPVNLNQYPRPAHKAAVFSNHGSQSTLAGYKFGDRIAQANSGFPRSGYYPSQNTQPARLDDPEAQQIGSNIGRNGFRDIAKLEEDHYSNVGGLPYPIWAYPAQNPHTI